MIHIGLNAHLLSSNPGYRAAGIHSVVDRLLYNMPPIAPSNWRFTAMVGGANVATYAGVTMRRARLNTESPLKRIIWEQTAQPFQLGDFDLLHAMAFVGPLFLTRPMVVTVYDLTFMRYPEGLSLSRRLYLRMLTGLTCRRARRVQVISHSTARDLTDLLGIPAEKIDVTPLGYDEDRFMPLPHEQVDAFRREQNLPERFWLFVGTIEPRKNLVTLLKAYASLPRRERLPLVLAGGKGWLYDDIFATIEHYQLHDDVRLPGFVSTESLPLWYNSAEVFVYPSVYEGFGLPVLEAMACGTPVITSNVSSLPEIAGNAGLCIAPHDLQAWADALRRAAHEATWRDEARHRGFNNARQFNWRKTAQLTLDSYQRALNLNPS